MSKVESHRDLIVWQKAMDMVVEVYRLADHFPKSETYRMIAQMTRAAVSVPANIAEGNARATPKEYAHFLSISKGSLMETETYLFLAVRLGYVTEQQVAGPLGLITEISKMLTVLRSRII